MPKKVLIIGPEGSGTTTTFVNLVKITGFERSINIEGKNPNGIITHFSVPNGRPRDIYTDYAPNPNSKAWLPSNLQLGNFLVVLVNRDKLDTIYSAYRRFFQTKPTDWVKHPKLGLVGIQKAIEFYEFSIQNIKQELADVRPLVVNYEDMTADPEAYYSHICDFIDVPFRPVIDFKPAMPRRFIQDQAAMAEFARRGWYPDKTQ